MTTNCIFFYSCQPSYIYAKKQINKWCQAIFSVSYLNFGSTHNMLNTVLICEKIQFLPWIPFGLRHTRFMYIILIIIQLPSCQKTHSAVENIVSKVLTLPAVKLVQDHGEIFRLPKGIVHHNKLKYVWTCWPLRLCSCRQWYMHSRTHTRMHTHFNRLISSAG